MKQIHIYCDGGFGNRYNCLVSGLAAAHCLALEPIVYWPCNNWCRAPYASLFSTQLTCFDQSLTALRGRTGHLTPLLHDELGARALAVEFNSAYAYASLDEVRRQALTGRDGLFYYPALIPDWLPREALTAAGATLAFHADLTEAAIDFIAGRLGRPYYGIHLRRTDLQIGLSDTEVKTLVQAQPSALFFVCSDDPLAERIAVAHDNVRIRDKSSHVSKKSGQGSWNDLTIDEDQRAYYSNIERGAAAVREAVVDLLVLAHSTIVGFTGSTFQSVARLIGQVAPLQPLDRPRELNFPALTDSLRRLALGRMSLVEVVDMGGQLLAQGRQDDGLCLLQTALNHYSDADAFPILFNLAVALTNAGRHGESEVFIDRALQSNPDYLDAYLLAAQICQAAGRNEQALKYLNIGLARGSETPIKSDRCSEFAGLITEIQGFSRANHAARSP